MCIGRLATVGSEPRLHIGRVNSVKVMLDDTFGIDHVEPGALRRTAAWLRAEFSPEALSFGEQHNRRMRLARLRSSPK